jgi:hypothetical protein
MRCGESVWCGVITRELLIDIKKREGQALGPPRQSGVSSDCTAFVNAT